MTAKAKLPEDYTGREFTITRIFDAPRELVFQAWTDPKHLAQWWGPRGFSNPVSEWDVRPGGKIFDVMRAPNGEDYPMGGEFREIVAPERVVFMCGPIGEGGALIFEFLHTAMFAEQNGKTTLTLKSRVLKTTPEANKYLGGFEAGMTQSLEKLTEWLAQKSEPLVIEWTYEAPAALVWEALTDKDKIGQWSFTVNDFKPEVGFEFEFYAGKNEVKYQHRCKITEVIPGKKLAYTWRYAGYAGNSLVTFDLYADGGQTWVKLTHTGLETFPQTPDLERKNFLAGWTHLLGTFLKEFVENSTSDREILISRTYDAPRELVWQAMTDPKHVVHWWGPRGFTSTIEVMDVRPGGEWKHVMQGPDGTKYPNHSIFKEVVKPERLVFTHGGQREGGPGVSFLATWTFDEVEPGKTRVTIYMVFPSAENRDFVVKEFGAVEGARQTLQRLGEKLAKEAVVVERTFNAPAEMVWQAITSPEHMRQWYFPELQSFKPEPGFQTEFEHACGDQKKTQQWQVTEVTPGKKISCRWTCREYPGESHLTMELFPEGSKTKLKLTHTGLETYVIEGNPKTTRGNFVKGWDYFINTALHAYLEKTQPPR